VGIFAGTRQKLKIFSIFVVATSFFSYFSYSYNNHVLSEIQWGKFFY
jgi:hypothetical protein